MMAGKTSGPSRITAKMIETCVDVGYSLVICIINQVIQGGTIPNNRCSGIIVSRCKGKLQL